MDKKRRIKLTIEYDGTNFHGWQIQNKTKERTVQGELQAALKKLPGTCSSLKGAGRTDAGVHAIAMTAHLDTNTKLSNKKLLEAINAHLDNDLVVIDIETVSKNFEAQFSAKYRHYIYRMRLARHDKRSLALQRNRVLAIYKDLDIEQMQIAAKYFEGTHDFSSFATQETRQCKRTVYFCKVTKNRNELRLSIAADGFVRGMVRAIVGTLIEVGEGKISAADIANIVAAKDRSKAGKNVKAHGLYFLKAGYNEFASTPDNSHQLS